jgi:hypothetical protein
LDPTDQRSLQIDIVLVLESAQIQVQQVPVPGSVQQMDQIQAQLLQKEEEEGVKILI